MLLFIYFSTMFIQGVLGCYIIEGWNIDLEIGETGFLTGATLRMVYYYYCSIIICDIFDKKFLLNLKLKFIKVNPLKKFCFEGTLIVLLLLLFLDLFLVRGIPLFKGINRVLFKDQLPFYIKISRSYILGMSSIILGYLYSLESKKRYLGYLGFILFYFILSSEKYGMLSFFVSNFFIGYIILKKSMNINKVYILLAVVVVSSILKFHYTKLESFGSKNPYNNIILRVGNGGQVFWKIDYFILNNLINKENKVEELKEYLSVTRCVMKSYGMLKVA
ncbi:MAG: hypothetical protein ACRC8F_11155 [Cetobacterium sp.]